MTQLTNLTNGLPKKPPPATYGEKYGGVDSRRGGRGGGGIFTGGRGARYGGRGGGDHGDSGGGRGGGRESGSWRSNEHGSSGSNNTPLGIRPPRASETSGKEASTGPTGNGTPACPTDDDEDEDGMPGYIDSTPPDSPVHAPIHATHTDVEGQNPTGGNTTTPNSQSDNTPPPPPPPLHLNHPLITLAPSAVPLNKKSAEENDVEKDDVLPLRSTGERTYDWAALRRGVRNERGDMCYYDGSFVEDPWAKLMERGGVVGGGDGLAGGAGRAGQ